MDRFIKAVPLGDLGDHLGIQTPSTAIVALVDIAHPGAGVAGAHAFIAPAGHRPAVTEFDGGNRLIHRATRGDLHDKKVDGDNRPQGGDHQQ